MTDTILPADGPADGRHADGSAAGVVTMLPEPATAALVLLYRHRLLTTTHLHRMICPHATVSYLRRNLRIARTAGYLTSIPWGRRHGLLWLLTDQGYAAVEQTYEHDRRPYRMTPQLAASRILGHRLAVTETGLAFVQHSVGRPVECTPYSWMPEVLHRAAPPAPQPGRRREERREQVIADAVLTYTVTAENREVAVLLEIDRGRYAVGRLVDKLATYNRLGFRIWRDRYGEPPLLLVVLADMTEAAATQRIEQLCGRYQQIAPGVRSSGSTLPMLATSLTALRRHGPWGATDNRGPGLIRLSDRARHVLVDGQEPSAPAEVPAEASAEASAEA